MVVIAGGEAGGAAGGDAGGDDVGIGESEAVFDPCGPCLLRRTMCHNDRITVTMIAFLRQATWAREPALPFWIIMCINDRTADAMKTNPERT